MRQIRISLQYGRMASIFFASILAKTFVDAFLFSISTEFGAYGLVRNGQYFDDSYWISWLCCALLIFSSTCYSLRKLNILEVSLLFLFFVVYLPITSVYWIQGGDFFYLFYSSVFWFSTFLLITIWAGAGTRQKYAETRFLRLESGLAFIFSLCLLILTSLVLVGIGSNFNPGFHFESVYERRAEFYTWLGGGALNYLYSWSAYVFSIYLIFVPRAVVFNIIGVLYMIFLYSSSGDKIYLFVSIVVGFIQYVTKIRRPEFIPMAMALVCGMSLILYGSGEIWVSSLVHRFLSIPADISFKFVDTFGSDPLFYSYSWLSSFVKYGFSDVPSKLVGDLYYTLGDNATASFLVDSYVNLGFFGLPMFVLFFVIVTQVVNNNHYSIMILPTFIQIIDTPLPTALLTGGGGLSLLIYLILSRGGKASNG